jgi:hypothetical protein
MKVALSIVCSSLVFIIQFSRPIDAFDQMDEVIDLRTPAVVIGEFDATPMRRSEIDEIDLSVGKLDARREGLFYPSTGTIIGSDCQIVVTAGHVLAREDGERYSSIVYSPYDNHRERGLQRYLDLSSLVVPIAEHSDPPAWGEQDWRVMSSDIGWGVLRRPLPYCSGIAPRSFSSSELIDFNEQGRVSLMRRIPDFLGGLADRPFVDNHLDIVVDPPGWRHLRDYRTDLPPSNLLFVTNDTTTGSSGAPLLVRHVDGNIYLAGLLSGGRNLHGDGQISDDEGQEYPNRIVLLTAEWEEMLLDAIR